MPHVKAGVIATEVGFCEGPVWTQGGRLIFTSIDHGCLYEMRSEGLSRGAETGGGPNGLTEGRAGILYVAQNGGSARAEANSTPRAEPGIQRVERDSVTNLARGLDAPNDLCFGPDDRLYFTDPRGLTASGERQPGRVYALAEGGEPELLVEGPAYTNGIAFGPDPAELYVAETLRQRVLLYRVRDGGLGEPVEFCRTEQGFPDGMCFDREGRLYVAATLAHEVQVFDRRGARVDSLPCGEESMPTNCCFGGSEGKTLFVTESRGGRVLAFDLAVSGLPLFPFR
jgi:gluconolactonase